VDRSEPPPGWQTPRVGADECMVVRITTTIDDRGAADRLAESLVADRLAACVHIGAPVRSTYRWRGVVELADEVVLTCTTSEVSVDACAQALSSRHPYELPQVLIDRVVATPGYAAWVEESTLEVG
jgi:periplasmic divalent cation tolerance protein